MTLDSAAVGAIIGALTRAGPELLKFFDRMLDRRHELAMQDKALAHEIAVPGRLSEKSAVDAGQLQDVLSLMREAYAQQFNTGQPWLNAVSVLVRPGATAVLVVLFVVVKLAEMWAALCSASGTLLLIDAALRAWTDNDYAIVSAVLSFWFVSRSLEKSK